MAQIQEALIAGEFDPTTDIEPTAAGPAADGPASDGGGSSFVEEEALEEGNPLNPDGTDDPDGPEDSVQPDAAQVTGNLNDIVDFDIDGPGTFSISLPLPSETPLPDVFSQGHSVTYSLNDTNTDSANGNLDHDYQTDHDLFDLSGLVKVGADEPLTWSLARPAGFEEDSNQPELTAKTISGRRLSHSRFLPRSR